MKKTELKDILTYNFLSNLEISDDKKIIAYTSSNANEEDNKYDSYLHLYNVENKSHFRASDNPSVSMYTFNSKSDLIYKEKSDDQFDYFYKRNLSPAVGEEAFKIDKNVSSITHLRDDIFLLKASDKKTKEEKEKQKDDDSVFKELSTLAYWFNGSGYLNHENSAIYLYFMNENKLEKIIDTGIENDINSFKISDDLKTAIYTKTTYTNGVMDILQDLCIYDLEKKQEKVLLDHKFDYFDIFLFGNKIIFVASDNIRNGINQNPFIYSIDFDGNLEKIVDDDFDLDFAVSTGTDARYGKTTSFRQDKQNNKLYFLATEKEDSKIYSIDINSKELKLELEGRIEDFALAQDNTIYYFAMSKDSLQELKESKSQEILIENKIKTSLGKIEEFFFESNGDKIRGFVLFPVDFDENKKYPTLLSIHGGPKTELTDIFHHEHQMFANDGYFVIYTNPHGSSGNGVDYSDIRGKYGTIDYEDLMNFTDEAIKRYPQIDSNNMGVYGGSYGGFMTNWIISHTDRFKAANSQRSISNWISFYGVSDIGYYFASDQTNSNPWDSLEKMWEQSPLKHAQNVKTPTLFIHSDEDYRCPLEQGLQMYSKLKLNGIETKMFVFHGENHELSRSGKPKGRIKRLTEIKSWFDGHLK